MPNGFSKKSVETLTLGEKLVKIRSERRISLNEVARMTKIQLKYLEDIENGCYDKLPSDVYVKGFLKNYAKFLGVNEKVLIRIYEKERDIKRNLEKNNNQHFIKQPEFLNISPWIFGPKTLIFMVLTILALAGFFYIYRELGSFANNPSLVILTPENNATVAEKVIGIEGRAEKDSKVFINDQAVIINEEGNFRQEIALQAGTNSINIRCRNRFEKETSEVLTVHFDFQEETFEEYAQTEKETSLAQSQGLDLEIITKEEKISLSVEIDGNLIFSGEIKAGEKKNFKAEKNLTLSSSNGKETLVRINGQETTLSDSPKPAKKVFNYSDNF